MYFAYGWPRVLDLSETGGIDTNGPLSSTEAVPGPALDRVVQLLGDDTLLVIITAGGIQLWSGGQHRVRLGGTARGVGAVRAEGAYKRAFWSSTRRLLAVVTTANVMQFFAARTLKHDAVPAASATGPQAELKRMELFLERTAVIEGSAMAADIVGDSRAVLVGMSDGSLRSYSWTAVLRGVAEPLAISGEDSFQRRSFRSGSSSFRSSGSGGLGSNPATPAWGRHQHPPSLSAQNSVEWPIQGGLPPTPDFTTAAAATAEALGLAGPGGSSSASNAGPRSPTRSTSRASATASGGGGGGAGSAVVALDYSSALRLLAVVVQDGRVAMCRAGDAGLASPEPIQLSHFTCRVGSGAVCARIGAAVQLVAVGLQSGDVALYKLYGSSTKGRRATDALFAEPLRVLSMYDWGYGPEVLGAVSALQWAPNNRALAVGWEWRGMVVWSPSGCRLMCSLRQGGSAGAGMTPRSAQPAASPFAEQAPAGQAPLPLESGIAALTWAAGGYSLLVAEARREATGTVSGVGGGGGGSGVVSPSIAVQQPPLAAALAAQAALQAERSPSAAGQAAEGAAAAAAAAAEAAPSQLLDLSFARSLTGAHRVLHGTSAASTDLAVGAGREAHALLAADRVLLVTQQPAGGATDLKVQHLRPPAAYLAANWPLRHAALSADGADVAVAGTRGLALYSRRSAHWRLFGNVSQERSLAVQGLAWIPRIVVACTQQASTVTGTAPGTPTGAQLRLYPRSHIDEASCLARYRLPRVPVAMDGVEYHVVVILPPLDIRLLHVALVPSSTPGGSPTARVSMVRELSIMSVGAPLKDIAIVQPQSVASYEGARSSEPRHCVLLRAGGVMTVLDLDQGSEVTLADDVECFWLSDAAPVATQRDLLGLSLDADTVAQLGTMNGGGGSSGMGSRTSSMASIPEMGGASGGAPNPSGPASGPRRPPLRPSPSDAELAADLRAGLADAAAPTTSSVGGYGDVEMPWWTYGWRGMALWFPSSLAKPLSPSTRESMGFGISTDPELEFDREVYPIGISLSEVAIVGVTQRMVLASHSVTSAPSPGGGFGHGAFPCFHAMPESQPVLPCLLRRLLQKGKGDTAAALAARHCGAPHFSRSLEWLLFTALEANADSQPAIPSQQRRGVISESAVGSPGRIPPQQRGGPTAANPQPPAGPQLLAAAQLIRNFPQFADVVVSVARKMDAALWPALFDAVGPPGDLAAGLLRAGRPVTAACCLLVVDRLQGAAAAHALALETIQAALDREQFELATELLRFLVPPGRHDAFLAATRQPREAKAALDTAAAGGTAAATALEGSTPQPQQPAPRSGWLATIFGGGGGSQQQRLVNPSSTATSGRGVPGGMEGLQTGMRAWRILAAAARDLLDGGRLRAAAHLGGALGAVGAALADLLCTQAQQRRAPDPPPPAVVTMPHALQMMAAEFPELAGGGAGGGQPFDAAVEAQQLQAACAAAGVRTWAAALALLLGDAAALEELRRTDPEVWDQLATAALGSTGWEAAWQATQGD